MFENIGSKIKTAAKVICGIGIAASIITAIVMFTAAGNSYRTEDLFTMLGFVFLILGPIMSWVGGLFIYGFGELIDKTSEIARNTSKVTETPRTYVPKKTTPFQATSSSENNGAQSNHRWRCERCGAMTAQTPCEACGYSPNSDKKQTAVDLLKQGLISSEEYQQIIYKKIDE